MWLYAFQTGECPSYIPEADGDISGWPSAQLVSHLSQWCYSIFENAKKTNWCSWEQSSRNCKKWDWSGIETKEVWTFKKSLTYFGHRISVGSTETNDSKNKVIQKWPTPKTVTEVRSFLGFTNLSISMHRSLDICIEWFQEKMQLRRMKLLCGMVS